MTVFAAMAMPLSKDKSCARLRLAFVVESGTDVRLAEGLAEYFDLTVMARRIIGGAEISQNLSRPVAVTIGPAGRIRFSYFAIKFLRARREQFDVVIVQGYGIAALAINLIARWTRIPAYMLVCSPAEDYYHCRKAAADPAKPYRKPEAMMIAAVARLNAFFGRQYIVLSEYLAATVRSRGARPAHVMPVYGVDRKIFCLPDRPKHEIRAQRLLPLEGSLIFFSSRIAPEKDADTLLAAVRLLVERGRKVKILHRSGGFRTFMEYARRFGVEEHVIATDAVHPSQELPLDYQASDVCVQASRAEGLGFSVLEAMACGTPVVAANTGGLRETVIAGTTGWSYPAGDAAALADCIAEVLDNPEEAQRRTELGRKLVLERFEREIVFSNLSALLNSHASSRKS